MHGDVKAGRLDAEQVRGFHRSNYRLFRDVTSGV